MRPRPAPVPSYRVHNPQTVNLMPVAHAHRERVTGGITSLQPIHHVHQQTAQNLSHPYHAKQTTTGLAQRVQHVQRHTHILTQGQHLIHIVMRPRPALVPSYRVHNPQTVNLMPVAHAHRERATGGITSLQPIHPVHRQIVISP